MNLGAMTYILIIHMLVSMKIVLVEPNFMKYLICAIWIFNLIFYIYGNVKCPNSHKENKLQIYPICCSRQSVINTKCMSLHNISFYLKYLFTNSHRRYLSLSLTVY